MKCPACGSELTGDFEVCPSCGAERPPIATGEPNPAARRVRIGFGVLMALVFVLVAAVAVLTPAEPSSPPSGSGAPTSSVLTTAALDPERSAIEVTIRGFYAAADSGSTVATSPFVYQQGIGGPQPGALDASASTSFTVTRAVIGSGTADVFGTESRSVVASAGAEVEFTLRKVEGGSWLISSWAAAREMTSASQVLSLTEATAVDVVTALLQARQVGDASTVKLLTTTAFQARHASWLDGVDRQALLTSWQVVSAKPDAPSYLVTVQEQWLPKPLTSVYTVVLRGEDILVDAWSFQ